MASQATPSHGSQAKDKPSSESSEIEKQGQDNDLTEADTEEHRKEKKYTITFGFGKHFGKTFEEVEQSGDYKYIIEMLRLRMFDKDEDMKKALGIFLDARKKRLQASEDPEVKKLQDITRKDRKSLASMCLAGDSKFDIGMPSGSALLSWKPPRIDELAAFLTERILCKVPDHLREMMLYLLISESDTIIYFGLDNAALAILPTTAVWEPNNRHVEPRKSFQRNLTFWLWHVYHLAARLHSTALATVGRTNFVVSFKDRSVKDRKQILGHGKKRTHDQI